MSHPRATNDCQVMEGVVCNVDGAIGTVEVLEVMPGVILGTATTLAGKGVATGAGMDPGAGSVIGGDDIIENVHLVASLRVI